jgi:AraC family transcriptional regulator, transcriptional activator of pobA
MAFQIRKIQMDAPYRTLKDFFRSVGLPLDQDTDFTVHRLAGLHGEAPMQSPAFRTDYHSFLLIESGLGNYEIDGQVFQLQRGAFYFTNPGHLKSFYIEEVTTGYMLTFSPAFLQRHFTSTFVDQFPFLVKETTPMMMLDGLLMAELATIYEQMLLEYERKSSFRESILSNLLAVLLFRAKELLGSHRLLPTHRAAELSQQFKALVQQNFSDLAHGTVDHILSIKELASQLNVHPNYLSNIIKAETGKAATEWIQDRTYAEAQSMLRQTRLSISEIAFALGFTDAAHLSKFFKKKSAGMTPVQYRQAKNL